MKRFYAPAGPLFMSLGLALLMCSLILTPANQALGQSGPPPPCPGPSCDGGCYACDPADQTACNFLRYTQCSCNAGNPKMPTCAPCNCTGAPVAQCTCQ